MGEGREELEKRLAEIRAEDQKQRIDRIRIRYSMAKLDVLQAAEVVAARVVRLKEEKR